MSEHRGLDHRGVMRECVQEIHFCHGLAPYYAEDGVQLYQGDVLAVLADLPEESVDCVVTSPPYWSLRKYSGEGTIWGGEPGCEHVWGEESRNGATVEGYAGTKRWQHSVNGRGEDQGMEARLRRDHPDDWTRITRTSDVCERCGAWRGQYGLEPTPELYVEYTIMVLRAIRRVLKPTGTVWWNIADSYCGSGRGIGDTKTTNKGNAHSRDLHDDRVEAGALGRSWVKPPPGMKDKDLALIPQQVAIAARNDGWYVRCDIIWSKPNPMPESITDRPTKSHEYVWLFSKSRRYFFDQDAVREPFAESTIQRITQESIDSQEGGFKQEQYAMDFPGRKRRDRKPAEIIRAMAKSHKGSTFHKGKTAEHQLNRASEAERYDNSNGRNFRSVWNIPTQPSPLPHFASFPEELAERCIKAGCPADGIVLDPFGGTGTTLKVARDLGRRAIGIEISAEYVELAVKRLRYGIRGVQAIERGQGTML